jgi:hypothetical protein
MRILPFLPGQGDPRPLVGPGVQPLSERAIVGGIIAPLRSSASEAGASASRPPTTPSRGSLPEPVEVDAWTDPPLLFLPARRGVETTGEGRHQPGCPRAGDNGALTARAPAVPPARATRRRASMRGHHPSRPHARQHWGTGSPGLASTIADNLAKWLKDPAEGAQGRRADRRFECWAPTSRRWTDRWLVQ